MTQIQDGEQLDAVKDTNRMQHTKPAPVVQFLKDFLEKSNEKGGLDEDDSCEASSRLPCTLNLGDLKIYGFGNIITVRKSAFPLL